MDVERNLRPCPECNGTMAVPTGMTGMSFLWGGVIGHKIMNIVQCQQCGTTYSGKYGWRTWQAALIYSAVVMVIFGGLYFLIFGVLLAR